MNPRTTRWIRQTSKILMFVLSGISLLMLARQPLYSDGFPPPRGGPYPPPPPPTQFGDPLPGLTAAQLADFADGLVEIEDEQTVESGLGPIFNNVSCVACHSIPATGGSSAILETRFGRTVN